MLVWALAFYLIENIEETHLEAGLAENVLQAALNQLLDLDTVFSIHNAILKVIPNPPTKSLLMRQIPGCGANFNSKHEHLQEAEQADLKSGSREDQKRQPEHRFAGSATFDQLHVYRSGELNSKPIYKPQIRFLDCAEHLEMSAEKAVQSNPDHLEQTVEKISAIFDRIRKGHVFEVEVMCAVLPYILNDFFSPFDILTKVIGEFLSTQQPHPKLLSRVVFQVRDELTSDLSSSLREFLGV